jgi:hypothetical protein
MGSKMTTTNYNAKSEAPGANWINNLPAGMHHAFFGWIDPGATVVSVSLPDRVVTLRYPSVTHATATLNHHDAPGWTTKQCIREATRFADANGPFCASVIHVMAPSPVQIEMAAKQIVRETGLQRVARQQLAAIEDVRLVVQEVADVLRPDVPAVIFDEMLNDALSTHECNVRIVEDAAVLLRLRREGDCDCKRCRWLHDAAVRIDEARKAFLDAGGEARHVVIAESMEARMEAEELSEAAADTAEAIGQHQH